MLRSIGDGIIVTNRRGEVVLMNSIAENLTGWSLNEGMGKCLMEVFHIVHKETEELSENPAQLGLETGKVVPLANHTMLIAKDGLKKILMDSAAPIRDENNNVDGVMLVFHDVTNQQKLEAELVKQQKLESLGILAAGIAHDFNNLLTIIWEI